MKTSFIGSIPNAEKEDIVLTKRILKNKITLDEEVINLEKNFKNKLGLKNIYLLNTGRASLYLILKTIGIKKGDEVITQSFSCMAASQPILWCKATPVYADIEKDGFNINVEDIRKKVTRDTRVVVIQHLFGLPGDVKDLIDDLNKNRSEDKKILLIEDCAHSLGAKFNNKYVGTVGDFAFFSFSQDKIISSIQGGAVTVNNEKYTKKFEEFYNDIKDLPKPEVKYLLKYQLIWNYIKKVYAFPSIKIKFTLGRALILISRYLRLIKQQIDINNPLKKEVFKMSKEQACLLNLQFSKLEKFNKHRIKIAEIYNSKLKKDFQLNKEGIFLRYPILLENREVVKEILKNNKIIVGNWYSNPIYPEGVDMELFKYKYDCPIAESKCKYILNLPTNTEIDENRAVLISDIVNQYGESVKF